MDEYRLLCECVCSCVCVCVCVCARACFRWSICEFPSVKDGINCLLNSYISPLRICLDVCAQLFMCEI